MILDLSSITRLVIEGTAYCNLHCPQCPRFNTQGFLAEHLNLTHLNPYFLSRNLDLSLLPKLSEVLFEGDYGDIMMHPGVTKFFDFFSDYNVTAITNGSLRSKDFWKKLANYKNLSITFSIDGLEDTNHIYRINSDWQKTIENAKAFIDAGGKASWKYIVFKHNEHQVEQARNLALTMGFSDFITQHSQRSWFQGLTWPVHVEGKYLYDIAASSKVTQESPRPTAQWIHNKTPDALKIRNNCWPVRKQSFYINHQGFVLPCCMTSGLTWQRDIQAAMWQKIIGDLDSININRNSLAQIMQSEFYQGRLETSFEKRCHPTCLTYCG